MLIMHEEDWSRLCEALGEEDRSRQTLHGEPVMVTRDGAERRQWRFPRSKRKRIRKKWRNDPKNWTTVVIPAATPPGEVIRCISPRLGMNLLGVDRSWAKPRESYRPPSATDIMVKQLFNPLVY